MMKKYLLFLFIPVFLFFYSGLSFGQSGEKVGFVDLSKAFDEYQKTKDFDRSLEKKGDSKQKEREKIVEDIRRMRDEVELLNEKARTRKESEIEDKIRSLQEFDQATKAELTKERDDMVRDILKEMNDVIQEYGASNSYSIILNDRVLLFGNKGLDLTDDIIKILNRNYKR